MEQACPFCGADLEDAEPGHSPDTRVCQVCHQEVDRPAGQAPPPPPPGQAPPAWGGQGPEPARAADSPAWEGPGGAWARLWRTIWQVLLHPARTFAAPARPGLLWAFTFGLIVGTLGSAVSAFWSRVLGGAGPETSIWWVLFMPVMVAGGMFIYSAIIHLFLLILGGAKQGFAATFRVVGYGNASSVFYLLPTVGLAVGSVWGIVVLVAGLAAAHGTGRGRTFLALFLPLVVVVLLAVAVAVALGLGAVLATLTQPSGGFGL